MPIRVEVKNFKNSSKVFLDWLDKNSADKIWSKNDMAIKVSALMPIRVKVQKFKNSSKVFPRLIDSKTWVYENFWK